MPDLAAALREYVDALVEPVSTDEVRLGLPSRGGGGRRRWIVLAAAVVLALVAAGVVATRDGGGHKVKTIDRPSVGAPRQFVGVDERAVRLGLYDATTGKRVRYLSAVAPGGGVSSPSVWAAQSLIYVSRGLGTCASAIDMINASGVERQLIGTDPPNRPFANPAISPDGAHLAYLEGACGPGDVDTLYVHGVRTPLDLSMPATTATDAVLGRFSWSPDGRYLAFIYGSPTDTHPPQVRVLDIETDRRVEDATTLTTGPCRLSTTAVAFREDGMLLVSCADGFRPVTVRAYDPVSGTAHETLFTVPATPDFELSVADGAVLYRSGDHLALWQNGSARAIPAEPFLRDLQLLPRGAATAASTAAPTTLAPAPTTRLIGPRLDPAHLGAIPRTGIAIDFGPSGTVVLLDVNGNVLGHLDHAEVLLSPHERATDGRLHLRVAGDNFALAATALERDAGPLVVPPAREINAWPSVGAGHWEDAAVSPDGRTWLAQWSGECEAPSAWFVDARTHQPRFAGPSGTALESYALGWLADGRALVQFDPEICAPALPSGPGVYAVDVSGHATPLYTIDKDYLGWTASSWTSTG